MMITYVEATGTTKKTNPSPLSSLIEILSEPENSSDVEEVNGPGPVLRDRVDKHKTEAAKIRLTTKPSSPSGLPTRTKEGLHETQEGSLQCCLRSEERCTYHIPM
jgi:hypothetical protein